MSLFCTLGALLCPAWVSTAAWVVPRPGVHGSLGRLVALRLGCPLALRSAVHRSLGRLVALRLKCSPLLRSPVRRSLGRPVALRLPLEERHPLKGCAGCRPAARRVRFRGRPGRGGCAQSYGSRSGAQGPVWPRAAAGARKRPLRPSWAARPFDFLVMVGATL